MIEKILFPVDFSPACAAMSAYVRRTAELFRAKVTLVHICDLASHNGFELYVRSPGEIAETHLSIAQSQLDSFLESELPAATCSRVLCHGEPAAEIADFARTGGFHLIIMPTHAGRFRQLMLGSTTAKVLDDVDCPVLTTDQSQMTTPRPLDHRVWVCGLSSSPDSERVLRMANGAAAEIGAKLSVVHVIEGPGPIRLAEPRQLDSNVNQALLRLAELQKAVGCEAAITVVAGPVREALLDAAGRLGADALIIGRAVKAGALGRMRDLTYGVLRHSHCPVLSV